MEANAQRPKVVVIGGGFGGLKAVQSLRRAEVDITLIDRSNHHLFQPLLYQVAMAALSPGDIATPIRGLLRRQRNARFMMAEVTGIDRSLRRVYLEDGHQLAYDYLVVATGNQPAFFGNDDWGEYAIGLKTLSDALDIRERLLASFERAAALESAEARQPYLTFVLVGGGPTGVEMAGAIAELGSQTLKNDYPELDAGEVAIYLLEGHSRLLKAYAPELSDRARRDLEGMGVKVLTNTYVTDVGDACVEYGDGQRLTTHNLVWAAGNQGTPLLAHLEAPQTRSGQVLVAADYALPDDENVFVIGDAAFLKDASGNAVPGLAAAANQSGEYVADIIAERLPRDWRQPFAYRDKGQMATIGRAKAVVEVGKLKVGGLVAWAVWSVVHVLFLLNMRSKLRVLVEWVWYYITFRPGARILYRRNARRRSQPAHLAEATPPRT